MRVLTLAMLPYWLIEFLENRGLGTTSPRWRVDCHAFAAEGRRKIIQSKARASAALGEGEP